MQCKNHPERHGTSTCGKCGTWLCGECTVDIQGRLYCSTCLNETDESATRRAADPMPRMTVPRRISWGLLFLFSFFFPPGANYMYLGLMKRGLVTMCGFFLLIYLGTITRWPVSNIFWFGTFIAYIASIFDGFNLRRRMINGEYIADELGDMLGGIFKDKRIATIALLILGFIFLGNIIGIAFTVFSRFMPLILVVLGLYVVLKRK